MAFSHVFLGVLASMASVSLSVSPVQKVLTLIDEMAVKVAADQEVASKEFEEFAGFSKKADTEKKYALKSSAKSIEALTAAIADATSTISSKETEISDLSTKISGTEGELNDVVALREKQNADFKAEEKQLLTDVESITAVVEQTSLAQMTPDAQRGVQALAAGLGHVADASFVMHGRGDKVAAFLQAREDGEDELSEGGAGGTLEKVKERSEAALKGCRQNEGEQALSHSMLKQSLENEIKGMKKELGEATHMKARAAEELAQSEKDLAVEKDGHSKDEAFRRDLKREFYSKGQDFEVEFKDASAELKALGAAKAILEKKFSSFLEARAAVRITTVESSDHKVEALRMIQQLGKRLHSTALIALSYRAAGDPFGKVRGMIEDMLTKLQQEAAEAADQKAFCDEEQGKSNKSKEAKEQDLAKTNSRLEKAESAVAELAEQSTVLSKELAENAADIKEATEIRTGERAIFDKMEKDLSESKEACGAAIQVLREYYEGASLVQVGTQSKTQTKARGGGGILQVLEFTEADFEKQLSDVRVAEKQAVTKFETFAQDSKMVTVTKEMELKGKQAETKSLRTSLSDLGEDKEGTSAELQAVLDYLNELKPKCEAEKPPSYAEKKAKREAEVQGLKEALQVLA